MFLKSSFVNRFGSFSIMNIGVFWGIFVLFGVITVACNSYTEAPLGQKAENRSATQASNPYPTITNTRIPQAAAENNPPDLGTMITIPAGNFKVGCDFEKYGNAACAGRQNLQAIYLDAFKIDKYEITNGQYAQCLSAGVCPPPGQPQFHIKATNFDDPAFRNHPVVGVSWEQAELYCEWENKRLPTEAEWWKAARGSNDTRLYPWGDDAPTCERANFAGGSGCPGDTTIVGSYPSGASPYGVMDIAGNASEWIADLRGFSPQYLFLAANNPLGPAEGDVNVILGGSWKTKDYEIYTRLIPEYRRNVLVEDNKYKTVDDYSREIKETTGFRCAQPLETKILPTPRPPASINISEPPAGKGVW